MAYIGKSPVIGNFVKLDAITAVNGQAAYTMQNGGANFTDYESVNQFLVSLNGTIQAPTDSFTVSGSTLTFASNLATGDVIDFIMVFGNSLSAGTPTDDTVTAAKLNDDIISGQTALASEPADTDEFLVSDSGVLKRMDYSHIKASSDFVHISTTTTAGASSVSLTGLDSTYKNYKIFVNDCLVASGNGQLRFRFINSSGDITSSSYYAAYDGVYKPYNSTEAALTKALYNNDYLQTAGNFDISSNNTNATSLEMTIPNPSDASGCPHAFGNVCTDSQNGSYLMTSTFAAKHTAVGAITGVKFYNQNGNNISGNFSLYGIKG